MGHLATLLIQEYVSHGFTVEVVPKWSIPTIHKATTTGPHTSNLTPTATAFCLTEILERSLRGFSTILADEDAIHLFVTLTLISRLALVEHHNRNPRLI